MDNETVAVELLARVDGFSRDFKRAAAAFEESMGKINTAAGKAEASSGAAVKRLSTATLQASTQMYRGFSDVSGLLQSNVSPFAIVAKQAPISARAFGLITVGASTLGGVLGGIAADGALTLVAALVQMALKGDEAKDAVADLVKKMSDQAKQAGYNRQADELWKHTVEGLTEAIRKRREEQEKSLQTDIQAEQQSLANSQGKVTELRNEKRRLQQDILALITKSGNARVGGGGLLGNNLIEASDKKLKNLYRRLANVDKQIAAGEASVRNSEIPISERKVANSFDAAKAATDRYTEALGKLRVERGRGRISQATFERKLSVETAKRDRDIKAAQDAARMPRAAKPETPTSPFILPADGRITSGYGPRSAPTKGASTFHRGIDIAGAIGDPVKASAAGVVIHTGRLGGLGNVVIVDHGGGTLTEYGHLSRIVAAKGQRVGQGEKIGEIGSTGISTGPHVDFRVKRNGKYVDPRKLAFPTDDTSVELRAAKTAEQIAEEAKRAADEKRRNDDAFATDVANANAKLLALKKAQVDDLDIQAAIGVQQIEAEQKEADRATQRDLIEGRIDAAKANQLEIAHADIAAAEKASLIQQTLVERLKRQDDAEQRRSDLAIDDLRFADENARTNSDHRRLQLEILDLVYQQKQKHLELLKAQADLVGNTVESASLQEQINQLPTDRARDQGRVEKGTMSPLEQWADQVPKTAAEINDALQSIEAQGLDSLADAITGVVTGTQSLGEAFSGIAKSIIADIIKMTVRMLIFRAISGAIGGGGGGGGGGYQGVLGTLLGGGMSSGAQPRALGGPIQAGRPYLVGEHGAEVVVPGHSGRIIPNNSRAQPGGGGGTTVIQHFTLDARHGITTPELLRHVNSVAAERARQAGTAAFDASQRAVPQRIDRLNKLGT